MTMKDGLVPALRCGEVESSRHLAFNMAHRYTGRSILLVMPALVDARRGHPRLGYRAVASKTCV
jgi:hypothetical protein